MGYVANKNTQTIHELDDKGRSRPECNLDQARRSGHLRVADPNRFDALYAVGYRNCGHCMTPPPKDTINHRERLPLTPEEGLLPKKLPAQTSDPEVGDSIYEPPQAQQEQQMHEMSLHPGIARHNPITDVQDYFVATD